MVELDILRRKLEYAQDSEQMKRDIRRSFKEHLRYITTAWKAAPELVDKPEDK